MSDYTAMFAALHRDNIIHDTDFPELDESSVRREMSRLAEQVGLYFSYDEFTGTATLFHQEASPEGATRHHATVLIAWMHLVWRQDYGSGAEHASDAMVLTAEARRKNREQKDFSLKAPFLAQRFHNTYPTLKAAANALDGLKEEGLLVAEGRDPIRYYATPLLRHAVDPDSAREVVWAHIRGDFAELVEASSNEDPRDRVLAHIETLADGYANTPRIAEDLSMTMKQVQAICDELKEDNLIRHELGTSQGGAWHRVDQGEEE